MLIVYANQLSAVEIFPISLSLREKHTSSTVMIVMMERELAREQNHWCFLCFLKLFVFISTFKNIGCMRACHGII